MDESGRDLTRLGVALDIVQADLDRTRNDAPRLQIIVIEDEYDGEVTLRAYVADGSGRYSSNVSPPLVGSDAVTALLSVAEGVQDFLAEAEWCVWPVCPTHDLGVHVMTGAEAAPEGAQRVTGPAWWCAGSGGHLVSAIGQVGRGQPGGSKRRRNNRR